MGIMKEDFDKGIQMAVHAKDINYFATEAKSIASKYGVSVKTVYNRFASMYGVSAREHISSLIEPSSEYLASLVLTTENVIELKEILNLPQKMITGIFDKHFGCSTYKSTKEKLLMEASITVRNHPFREDNVALLMSQYLGDGSYDKKRHALRVVHGMKQAEYLKWKVGLLHDGYNEISTKITQHLHKQGHEYVSWYSGKLGNVDFPENMCDAVKLLTPLGWLLLYFDDGCYGQDIHIVNNKEDVAVAMQQELLTYGIKCRVNKCSNANAYTVTACGGEHSIRFYKNFIEPYLSIIPLCMRYKTEVKI